MALAHYLNNLKREGNVIAKLDHWLLTNQKNDPDRRWDINSPSQAGKCVRAIYYGRTGVSKQNFPPRTIRIFDNGSGTHERLEGYLIEAKIACLQEVPLVNDEYEIQGTADLLITMRKKPTGEILEVAVGEIKSINDNGFKSLKDAKPEHKIQANSYIFSLEERRKWLKKKCKNSLALKQFLKSQEYVKWINEKYGHLRDGSRFTKQEKLAYRTQLHHATDTLLWGLTAPIKEAVFIYENKNDQELKEFLIPMSDKAIKDILADYATVNEAFNSFKRKVTLKEKLLKRKLKDGELRPIREACAPKKQGKNKSCETCRWCDFVNDCWS